MEALVISIRGVVQGVGFRPFIYRLAGEMDIKGSVSNTSDGLLITAEGQGLENFIERIRMEAPPLSKIESISISPSSARGYQGFEISESIDSGAFTLVSPDISICSDCRSELFDSSDRRYLYPFINCTNCGPRYSIVRSVPYDRPNTTMSCFRMCRECEAEYNDPADRRFHAQPNACPVCGPGLTLLGIEGSASGAVDPVASAIELLCSGKIIALKGLGGFHIACDAMNADAVLRLRGLKRKSNKPFALMAPDMETIRQYCLVTDAEEELLNSPQRPVVLLRKRSDNVMPDAVSPNNRYLGFMLPYTPLHYMLFNYPPANHRSRAGHHLDLLVMTSGNISEEPIIISNDEAVRKLKGMVDAFIVHNRDIFMRVDDSVVRHLLFGNDRLTAWSDDGLPNTCAGRPLFVRRARGYAPDPILLADDGPDLLGCGADMKNTFTLGKGRYAVMSQHIGDMENYEARLFFEETLSNLKSVYRAEPVALAYDLHPGYLSSQWAMEHGREHALQMFGIQHHFAHIGSVMAEHGLKRKVIGVAFDGTGYGTDGSLWGGEFLVADASEFIRAGHLRPVALPGGEKAIEEPWRTALSYLNDAYGDGVMRVAESAGLVERFGMDRIKDVLAISYKRQFSPLSSGAGRLFDAVSALLGICHANTFEGEAAISLESCIREDVDDDYPLDIHWSDVLEVDFSHAFIALVDDMLRKTDRAVMAARFHNTVATAIIRVVIKLSMINNIKDVALGGGTFQNLYLLRRVMEGLRTEGLKVYINEKVPCNDACISLGQMYIARAKMGSQ